MSAADQTFIQVMATILVGTFIAYAVDLRAEHSVVDASRFSLPVQRLLRVSALGLATIPLIVMIAILAIIGCVLFDSLPFTAELIIVIGATDSIVALGVAKGV